MLDHAANHLSHACITFRVRVLLAALRVVILHSRGAPFKPSNSFTLRHSLAIASTQTLLKVPIPNYLPCRRNRHLHFPSFQRTLTPLLYALTTLWSTSTLPDTYGTSIQEVKRFNTANCCIHNQCRCCFSESANSDGDDEKIESAAAW